MHQLMDMSEVVIAIRRVLFRQTGVLDSFLIPESVRVECPVLGTQRWKLLPVLVLQLL